ncbi:MAG: MMPL family transporter, partial [Candidatus Bipolaricaulia bacterium]
IQGDIKDPATLKIMRSVERYLDTVPAVSESESIASVLAEMNSVMNDRYAIPETRRGVTNLWFLLKGQDILDQLVTPQGGEALVQAKVNSLATAVVSRAVESGDEFIKTLPTRLVVVNSGDLSGEVQRELLAIQRERIVDDVLWELQAEGIAIERGPVAELVGGGRDFTLGSLPEEMYGIIQNSIKGYLQSDMAEIPFGEAQAEALAGEITTAMMEAEQRLSPAEIEEIVRPRVVVEYPEEITWLSESLAILIAKTAGELRVDGVFQKLEGFLPAGALDANLAKEIKGSLWGLNEQTVLLDEEEYQRLSANLDLGQVRRVSLAIKQSGMAPILNRMEKELLPTQIESTILALLAVTILLILVFRSLKSGLIGIVPVALTILVNFAVLGYFGIGLDSFTAMIASITIGLGIDYAIHFTSRFKLELGRAEDERAALKRTLQTTGVAILINAFSIGAGFSALLLAGGQHIRLLGGLTALALVVAALFTLFVIPALSLTFKPGYMRHSIAERGAGERAREARVSEGG